MRRTLEEIREAFNKEGYTLLTEEYKNNNQKLEYVCPNNHRYSISWSKWQQGRRCKYCSREAMRNKRKLDFNIVKQSFESEGYTLLTKEYKNNTQKLDYICPNGHKHSITWADWKQGRRCLYCGIEKRANKRRLAYEFIMINFESEGYKLLSEEYKNAHQKLEYICQNNHIHSISWSDWKQGKRCPYCSGKAKKTIEEIREAFEKEGYTLLTKKYKNGKQKLEYICPRGHKHFISWRAWKSGERCGKCKIKYYSKDDLENFNIYKEAAYNLTNRIYKKYKSYINPNNYKRGKYSNHLDHIYSVIDGFNNNVSIEVISNPNNLRLISAKENNSKNGNSYISKMMLYHLAV